VRRQPVEGLARRRPGRDLGAGLELRALRKRRELGVLALRQPDELVGEIGVLGGV